MRATLMYGAGDVRIDERVAPGVTMNPDDKSYGGAELAAGARRR